MEKSGTGTAFAIQAHEAEASMRSFVIHWAWPVPFPQNPSEMALMIDSGNGGKGECPKSCFDCQGTPGVPGTTKCVASCSGYETCQEDGTGNGCQMTPIGGGKCASGWSGSWVGS